MPSITGLCLSVMERNAPPCKLWLVNLGIENRVIFAGHQERPEDFLSAFDLCFFSSYIAEGVSRPLSRAYSTACLCGLRIPSTMEPLSLIEDYRVVDYDDVPAACKVL